MGDTVSNQLRLVVNKGSNATAMQTAPDVCKLLNLVPQGFGNTAPLPRLGAGKSTKTTIKNQPICLQGSHIGPLSDAAHAGVVGGVISGTYRMEAEATSYSNDLFVEGKPVVRLNDTTIQNHGNTLGLVVAGIHYAMAMSLEEYAKKKCNLQKLDGFCNHGRKLGWPDTKKQGEPKYLEVLTNDNTIVFTVVRKDITKTPHEVSPKCVKEHTAWSAECKQFPTKNTKKIVKKGVDSFIVDADMAISTIAKVVGAVDVKTELEGKRKGVTGLDRAGGAGVKGRMKSVNVPIKELLAYWAWRSMPPIIDVKAVACSGAKTATLKVYPHRLFTFTFSLGASSQPRGSLAKIKSAVRGIQKTASVAKKVFAWGGKRLDVKFMVGFEFEWQIQYKENTQTKGYWRNKKYTPATVGRDWMITVGAKPLIGVGATITYSLLNFIAPGLGAAAAALLRKLGTRVDLEFTIDLSCYLNVKFGKDEYDYPKFGGFNVGIDLTMAAAAIAGVVGISITFKASFPSNLNLLFNGSKKPNTLIEMKPSFYIRTDLSMTVKAWKWFSWKAAEGSPKALSVVWKPKWAVDVWSV